MASPPHSVFFPLPPPSSNFTFHYTPHNRLQGNQITTLTPVWAEIPTYETLEARFIEGSDTNPLQTPPLEVCKGGLKVIRAYFHKSALRSLSKWGLGSRRLSDTKGLLELIYSFLNGDIINASANPELI